MEHQVSDILSLAALVILLSFSTLLGGSAVMNANKSLNEYSETYQDKTTPVKYTASEKTYGTYDGTLTREELILMSMIQDSNLAENRDIKLGNYSINITASYKENVKKYKGYAVKWIDKDSSSVSYPISYDYENNQYIVGKQWKTTSYKLGGTTGNYYVTNILSNTDTKLYPISDELYNELMAANNPTATEKAEIKIVFRGMNDNDYIITRTYK